MGQPLQRLRLSRANASVILDRQSFKEYGDVLRDIQTIHNPSAAWLTGWWGRTQANMWRDFNLPAQPRSNVNPMFEAHVSCPEEGVRISFNDPSHPSRAAGWAAMQLYGQLLGGGKPLIDTLHAVDPLEGTVERYRRAKVTAYTDRIVRALKNTDVPPNPSTEPPPMPEFIVSPRKRTELIKGEVSVLVFNNYQRSLPGVLHVIHTAYDELYPEAGSPATSVAVAGIVGAGNLEDFTGAWNDAATYRDDPAVAARTLLGSGVFLADT